MQKQAFETYQLWLSAPLRDADLKAELEQISGDEAAIFDRFYRDLEFGTGGLRGVIGAGTNRLNVHTVARATQGYCSYLHKKFTNPSVAIGYDSRNKSTLFAQTAACVFAANGVRVHLYRELMPTPALSYAVRALHCDGGIVVTASHNPAKYNGYKVYGADGCQITLEAAKSILGEISQVDTFEGVKLMEFEQALEQGAVSYIPEQVITDYLNRVSKEAFQPEGIDKNVAIVYTPLNGAGLGCVTRILRENGYTNISVVKEQEQPDGNFPTCPYPNPEIQEALALGLQYCQKLGADLLLANDPDCDRVGTAVRDGNGYRLISGNEMGVLLFDYICKMRTEQGTMPQNPVAVKTIVTTEMAAKVAEAYGVELRNTLTGFKFIGEQIGLLEKDGQENRYIWGFEESYGYLSGSFVRDKDGVNASLLICEMFAYYQSKGLSLVDVLHRLYAKYGAFQNALQSFTFEGAEGFATMQKIMADFRENAPAEVLGRKVLRKSDYKTSVMTDAAGKTSPIDMPSSDVLKFDLEGDISLVVRPSGTEPKLKIYYSVKADSEELARALVEQYQTHYAKVMDGYR